MRKIRGCAFVSLDGVCQAPGGPTEDPTGGFAYGGWLPQFFDEGVGEAIDAFFAKPYDLLLGRRTYDIFAAYWPYVGQDPTGHGELFDLTGKDEGEAAAMQMGADFTAATKYVVTGGGQDLPWSNSVRVRSIGELAAIKAGEGPDLLIQGSSTLYPQLIAAGLLDELTLTIFPAVLGQGKRLLGDGPAARSMRLRDQKTTPSGAIVATYEPAGEIGANWAGPEIASEREKARRAAMAEGRW